MNNKNIQSDFLRGHVDSMILKMLLDGDKYGYEIAKLISAKTKSQFELNEATMYSSLRRLEKNSLVTSYWGEGNEGARRKYYQITDEGRETYAGNKRNWAFAKKIIDKFL